MPEATRTVGRYEILREIGRGGMAVVYAARQSDLNRVVALKELSAFHAATPEHKKRFLRESQLTANLTHSNIVTVHEYFVHGETPYIAMEYLERGSLRPYVPHLTLMQAGGVLEGLLTGLEHAEEVGVVHRDLKPENVMVTAQGRIKIADFGIAKVTGQLHSASVLTLTGTTVGTPAYMAPEQAMAQEVGPSTDLYSVGCVAFELVTGRTPFHDTHTPAAVLLKQVNAPVPPAKEINPDVPQEISDWIEALVRKDPLERPQSAQEALEDLEEILIGIGGPRWARDARLRLPPEAMGADRVPGPATPPPEAPVPDEIGYLTFEGGGADTPTHPARESPPPAPKSAPKPEPEPEPEAEPEPHEERLQTTIPPKAPPPEPTPKPEPTGRRRWGVLAGAALAVVAVVVAVLLVAGGGGDGDGEAPPEPAGGPQVRWKFPTRAFVASRAAVAGDRVVFGSQNQDVYALDAATGQEAWSFETGRIVVSSPLVAGDVVYVGSHDGSLYAIDLASGEQRWRFGAGSEPVQSSPAIADDLVFVAGDDGRIQAVRASTGRQKWEFETGQPIFSSPAVAYGLVFVGSQDGNLYALDAATGKKRWRARTENQIWSSPAVADGTVYVGSNDRNVYAFNARNGKERWRRQTGDVVSSSPHVVNGTVYVGSFDDHVYALNATSGEERWRFKTGGDVFSSPTVADGVVYVGSKDANVYAIDAASGRRLWAFKTGANVGASPTVEDGVLYVGSDDGNLYALTLPET